MSAGLRRWSIQRARAGSTFILAGFLAAFFLAHSVEAQVSAEPGAGTEYRRAFEEMSQDLANPEKSFRFAEAASRAGNIGGAIAALERILLVNPELDNIRLELGVLYLRAGNLPLGRYYLAKALESPAAPPEVRTRAQGMLADAERALARNQFSGTLFVGGRYDTNANAGPAGNLVRGGGVDLRLDDESTEQADFSFVSLATLRHSYDFATQGGSRLETNLTGYVARYAEQEEVNLGLAQIDVGPWLAIDDVGSLSLRPFGVAGRYYLEDRKYLDFFGGGLAARKSFGSQFLTELSYQYQRDVFHNSPRRPFSSDRTGPEHNVRLDFTYLLDAANTIGLSLRATRADANQDFEANDQWGIGASYTVLYPLFGLLPDPASTTLTARFSRAIYDEPDPFIDPGVTRRDDRKEISLLNSFPLWRSLSLVLNLQYLDVSSTLPNFTYDNFSVTLGVAWRF